VSKVGQNEKIISFKIGYNFLTPVQIAAAAADAVNNQMARNAVKRTKPTPLSVPRTATTSVMARVHSSLVWNAGDVPVDFGRFGSLTEEKVEERKWRRESGRKR
jgi:hypothetical protein